MLQSVFGDIGIIFAIGIGISIGIEKMVACYSQFLARRWNAYSHGRVVEGLKPRALQTACPPTWFAPFQTAIGAWDKAGI